MDSLLTMSARDRPNRNPVPATKAHLARAQINRAATDGAATAINHSIFVFQ
jgi:hypothetical protein